MEELQASYRQIEPDIIQLRRTLHQHPELEFDLFHTADSVCALLDKYEIPYDYGIAKTGIVAHISGARPGKTLLIRADMDALPIAEQTGLPYASQIDGCMHACGHDIHTAAALAAAILLHQQRTELAGTVKVVFQPAEEGVGGAQPMIAAGIMEHPHVDACIAAHISPQSEVGTIQVRQGGIMASPDHFTIAIQGKSTHGAEPQNGHNPVAAAAELTCRLQNQVVDQLHAAEPCILSVCYINGGEATNIIPDHADMGGTFRCFDDALRHRAKAAIEHHILAVEKRYGVTCKLDYHFLYPPVVNDTALTQAFAACAEKYLGKKNVHWLDEPFMLGDDFAYFAQNAPGCYFRLGCRTPGTPVYPLHSSRLSPDEQCIGIGAALMAAFALEYCRK